MLIYKIAICAAILAFAGCKIFSSSDEPVATELVMPDFINTDLNKAGIWLQERGLSVIARQEAYKVSAKDEKNSFMQPKTERAFEPLKWNHMVSSQLPAAGTPLKKGDLVTLTAGMHHGAGMFAPWLQTHKWSIAVRGDTRCADCHTKQSCIDCHDKIGIQKVK